MIKIKMKIINLYFFYHVRDFHHLIHGFQFFVKSHALPLFFSTFTFYHQTHFSQQLLEPRDIKIVHKHPNSMTCWHGQVIVPK